MTETSLLNEQAQTEIAGYIERIERLQTIKREADDDIAEIYKQAKGEGFNTVVLKKLIAKRARDPAQLSEEDQLLDLYEGAANQAAGR